MGPYTVLNPGPNTFLGKAQTGRTATRLNVGNTQPPIREQQGRTEKLDLLCVVAAVRGVSLCLRESGQTRGGRKCLDRLPGEVSPL